MTDRIGQHIDAYCLTRLLGTGSSGEVYLGKHLDYQTLAAVKLLNLNQENVIAFVKKASTIIRLKHPHILPLLAFGISADDLAYLVMDYAPNGTLRQRHPKGTCLPLDTVISYISPLAAALQYAHDRNITHCQIKPDHVFIRQDGEVLLSNFALTLCAPLDKEQLRPQNMAEIFPYMAPEQLHGQPQAASDQYALGVIVYEWLCGESLFQRPLWEIVDLHQSSQISFLHEKLADLPSPVQESLLKALAKDPQDRFARIEDFATTLHQLIPVVGPSAALPSLTLPSTTAFLEPEQVQDESSVTPTPLPASSPLAPDELPSAETLTDKHQPVLAAASTSSLPTAAVSDLTSGSLPASLSSSPAPAQPEFVSRRRPAIHHALARTMEFLAVGLLLLLAIGSTLFTFAVGTRLVKFPFAVTTPPPPLAPRYLTATAAALAYAADTAKNGMMFGFDPAHTHWNPYEKILNKTNVPQLKPRWSYATNDTIVSSPTVANGIIYVGSWDHNLYAFDASCRSSCQPLWFYTTGGHIDASPAVANGLVYVGSVDHKLYAFDASCRSDCQPLWSYATGDAIGYSSPTVANGLVYVGSMDHKLYAFDASCRKACQPLWSYATGDAIGYSSPTVANGIVYVGSLDHKLYAFDASCHSACQPLWFYATDNTTGYSSPASANDIVYIGSYDHKLYAFDTSCRSACQPLWSYTTGSAITSSPTIADGIVYVGSWDHNLYAFDVSCRSSCQPLWSYTTGNVIYSSPTVADGIVYVGSEDHGLYAFDTSCRSSCQPLWSYATEGRIICSPVVANGIVYVGSYDHKLYAFGIRVK